MLELRTPRSDELWYAESSICPHRFGASASAASRPSRRSANHNRCPSQSRQRRPCSGRPRSTLRPEVNPSAAATGDCLRRERSCAKRASIGGSRLRPASDGRNRVLSPRTVLARPGKLWRKRLAARRRGPARSPVGRGGSPVPVTDVCKLREASTSGKKVSFALTAACAQALEHGMRHPRSTAPFISRTRWSTHLYTSLSLCPSASHSISCKKKAGRGRARTILADPMSPQHRANTTQLDTVAFM